MAGSGGDSYTHARQQCDVALGVMRDNMKMLAERDVKLHDLQDKSTAFQTTSERFQRHTTTLSWKTRWQQYRFYAFIGALVVWGLLLILFRQHLLAYVIISSSLLGAAFGVFKLFERRLSLGPESEQPLTASGHGGTQLGA